MMAKSVLYTHEEQLCLEDFCKNASISTELLVEVVGHGIIEPVGDIPENWQFDTKMLITMQKAIRLHEDLEIDWPGIALAISLLDEVRELKEINQQLERQINRFHHW